MFNTSDSFRYSMAFSVFPFRQAFQISYSSDLLRFDFDSTVLSLNKFLKDILSAEKIEKIHKEAIIFKLEQ